MRVVDLRPTPAAPPPAVEIVGSSGGELARLVGTLLSADPSGFDVGSERIAAVRAAVPPDLLDAARRVADDDETAFLALALLAGALPEPAGVAELLDALRAVPDLAWRTVLAHHTHQSANPDEAELQDRIIAGDSDAIATLRRFTTENVCSGPVEALLSQTPEAYGETVIDVLARFAETVWHDLEAEAMGPIERDAAHRRRQLASGMDPAQVVLEATNGYELTDDPAVRRVVLMPSYWFRPWIVIARRTVDGDEVEFVSTAVADEFLALPREAPPPSLLKLFKSLADPGRLRLLRRMSTGPISLGEATTELGVAKATAHHHLSILRQAGLVTVGGEGRASRYALRDDPAEAAHAALLAYVRPPGTPAPRS